MKEIILKRYGSSVFLLEILEDNLRIYIGDNDMGASEDFSLEEIDELQEAISIMKDKLSRKLSPKKETFEFELPTSMSVKDFEELTGCKCKPSNEKLTTIVTSTEQKDANNVSDNEQKLVYGGEIADFPIEIVEKMLEYQVEQYNKRDVSVFEDNCCENKKYGGFNWLSTIEGIEFWTDIIKHKKFNLFFERYPKKNRLIMPDISKCANQDCIKREICYRFTSTSTEYRQAYGEFTPNRNLPYDFYCRWFIGNENFNKK